MNAQRPLLVGLLLLTGVIAVGTGGYVFIEGWPVLDALWMVVITLTSIGYGEVHPLSDGGRVFTIGLIFGGLSVGTWVMSQVTSLVLDGQFGRRLRERRRRRQMEALRDHVIVVGYGRLGRIVARSIREAGSPIVVVEQNPTLLAEAAEVPGVHVLEADGSHDTALRAAGIDRCRGVAVTASPVAQAVFITLTARHLHPTVPILTRVETDEDAEKARRAGATDVVSPAAMGGWRMAQGLLRPHTASFLDLATLAAREDMAMDELTLDAHSRCVDQTIGDLDIGAQRHVLVVAIRRAGGEMEPTPVPEARLRAGDTLIVVGRPTAVAALGRRLAPR